jgi:hypothetical protein
LELLGLDEDPSQLVIMDASIWVGGLLQKKAEREVKVQVMTSSFGF